MGAAADVVGRKNETFNEHDSKAVRALMSTDVEWTIPGAFFSGADQVMGLFEGFWEAFPDMRLEPLETVEGGEFAVIRAIVRGTHRGTMHTPEGDIPPTGRPIELHYSEHFHVRDNLVVAGWLFFDRLELLEQLGVAQVPATA